MEVDFQNKPLGCGCCLTDENLHEASSEMLEVYQLLVTEHVDTLNLCPSCIELLEDVQFFIAKCRKSFDALKLQSESPSFHISAEYEDDDEISNLAFDNLEVELIEVGDIPYEKLTPKKSTSNATGERVNCEICGTSISNRKELIQHFQRVHQPRDIPCPQCSKTFSCSKYLKRHVRNRHGRNYCFNCNQSYAHLTDQEFAQHMAEGHSFTCSYCSFESKYKNTIPLHIKNVHNIEEKSLDGVICIDDGQSIIKDDDDPEETVIDELNSFDCSQCDDKFENQAQLNSHTSRVHKVRICEHCFKEVPSVKYNQHIRIVHYQAKNYQCSICGAKFFNRGKVKRHLYTHGKTKAFNCHICGQGFCDARSITNHYRTNHGIDRQSKDILKIVVKGEPDVGESCILKLNA